MHKLTPVYLQNLFTPRSTEYFIRDLENKLYLAKPRTEYLKRSFSNSGALLWNDLPKEMRNLSTLSSFKRDTQIYFQIGFLHGNHEKQLAV